MSRITVKELREALSSFDGDLEVHIAYDYGDYWRNVVAPAVHSVETSLVVYSAYHSMDKVVDDEEEDELIDALNADCDEGHVDRERDSKRLAERTPRRVLVLR